MKRRKRFLTIAFLISAIIATIAYAVDTKTIINPQEDGNLKIQANDGGVVKDMISINGATGTVSFPFGATGISAAGTDPAISTNILWGHNNDIEGGTAANFSNTGGTLTATNSAGEVADGTWSLKFVSTVVDQYLQSDLQSINDGLEGRDCEGSLLYKGTEPTTLSVYESANKVVEATLPASTTWRSAYIAFACGIDAPNPQYRIRVTSTTAGDFFADNFHIGSNKHNFDYSTAELYGAATWDEDADCSWIQTPAQATWTSFPADATCTFPSGDNLIGNAKAPGTGIPAITFDKIEAGIYIIKATGPFTAYKANATFMGSNFRIYDGVSDPFGDEAHLVAQYISTQPNHRNYISTIESMYVYTTAKSNVTFEIQALENNAADAGIESSRGPLVFKVYRFPLESQKAVTVDTSRWYIQGNIGGTNINLSGSDQSTYIPLANSGLDMTLKTGSADAEITCNSTNAPTGLTCDVGSENLGVAFTPPWVGEYFICFGLSHKLNQSGTEATDVTFQIVETQIDDDSVILTHTKIYAPSRGSVISSQYEITRPISLCGIVTVDNVSKKAFRVYYEQDITGTMTNQVVGDRAAATGQPEISFSIVPIKQGLQQAYVIPQNKFQIKYMLHAGAIGTTCAALGITSMDYSNLVIGKYYKLYLFMYVQDRGESAKSWFNHNGVNILWAESNNYNGLDLGYFTFSSTTIFQAAATDLYWECESTGNTKVQGRVIGPATDITHSWLQECNECVPTTEY